jgi:hypothetical protein
MRAARAAVPGSGEAGATGADGVCVIRKNPAQRGERLGRGEVGCGGVLGGAAGLDTVEDFVDLRAVEVQIMDQHGGEP